ncbi:hypothetical protein K491DRAFT_776735 [Lophiostoma macrostomum CBS 122681]|uniref:2EXR domain-containing protein n=1 Tax=Lophiostoma macrostomum CBS 122681 TaxID=1314788 RepID=A0A6A6TH96_9PLEO|nr:hypothetical protein K491DRAFT_776735 [Lophiostoma macrostomum CBS 122681]
MSVENTFTCFNALPAELRLAIWEYALSEWVFWAATTNGPKERHLESPNSEPTHMEFIGSTPYVAGISCREARRVLEQAYSKLCLKPATPITGPGTYWLDFKRTVVYLGADTHAVTILDSFDTDTLSKLEHVGVSLDRRLFSTCRKLEESCPNLQTLIVRRLEYSFRKRTNIYRPVDLGTATQFVGIAENSLHDLEGGRYQNATNIRARILRYFGGSKLKVYFLPIETTRWAIPEGQL